jgi:hypothetical protein
MVKDSSKDGKDAVFACVQTRECRWMVVDGEGVLSNGNKKQRKRM